VKKLKLIALLSFVMIVSITMVGCNNNNNGSLDSTTKTKIIQDYHQRFLLGSDIPIEDVKFDKFLGVHNGYHIVFLNPGERFWATSPGVVPQPIEIGGVVFNYPLHNVLCLVWKESEILHLHEAFDNGILELADIQKIKENDK
jgi:hypothetical protein